jgi:hypothetical protein
MARSYTQRGGEWGPTTTVLSGSLARPCVHFNLTLVVQRDLGKHRHSTVGMSRAPLPVAGISFDHLYGVGAAVSTVPEEPDSGRPSDASRESTCLVSVSVCLERSSSSRFCLSSV